MIVNKIVEVITPYDLEIDGVTLLSAEEAEEFLGIGDREYVDDWLLRSPGEGDGRVAFVHGDGAISNYGCLASDESVKVRPALKISNLESSTFRIGDSFMISCYRFKIISPNLAFMECQDIGYYAFNYDCYNKFSCVYSTSDVKEWIEEWYENLIGGTTI